MSSPTTGTSTSSVLKWTAACLGVSAAAYGAWQLRCWLSNHLQRRSLVAKYHDMLVPSLTQLQAIKQDIIVQLEAGLQADVPVNGKHMLCLPTFVTQLPTGQETGDVYAIDLGGTNFRVVYVQLSDKPSKVAQQDSTEVAIPREVYTGTGTALFDFLALHLSTFIREHGGCTRMKAGALPVVGFCFSFATHQTALDQGTLLTWTKGFTCTGVVGHDPVGLLSEAMQRVGCPCKVAALLNDTVGVLAAHRYLEPTTAIGVIVGTGTNACYVERVSNVTKWSPPEAAHMDSNALTAINIEWGAFDSPSLPRCPEDADVDAASPHPGGYMFEKLISGLFLGEVARRVLLHITADTKMFGDFSRDTNAAKVLACLAMPGSFTTAHLAAVVQDDDRALSGTAGVLAEALGVHRHLAPPSTRAAVRAVCEAVALRSAAMVAVALDAILAHSGWDADQGATTVAFDGGVYEKFPAYRTMVYSVLRQLRGDDASQVFLQLSHDGSCLGAAVLAAAAVAGQER